MQVTATDELLRKLASAMPLSRRSFLTRTALGLTASVAAGGCRASDDKKLPASLRSPDEPIFHNSRDWEEVRGLFSLNPDVVHMSALYVASHPKPVRDAIEYYRRELDTNPVVFLNQQNRRRVNEARDAAARYLGVEERDDIALTDSTTMGLGLVYNGLRLGEGDEVVTTLNDYYVTHESLRLASERKGIVVRRVQLYEDIHKATEDSLTKVIVDAINPRTRALALTWVHSGTGLKLPIARICNAVQRLNAKRDDAERVLVVVDGVHGFGVEDVTMPGMGCDFFIAGCHKWLFGPRGTGIIWGSAQGWERMQPIVPSFHDDGTREAWMTGTDVTGRTDGRRMTPGGFKPFEHQWAISEAFAMHEELGKARVQRRTHDLASQLKEGLRKMRHVSLRTPMSQKLSAGIVCLEVDGMDPWTAVARLRERGIIATVTPYAERYLRFAPSIRNSPQEVEKALEGVRALA
ncbi:MAG TPA: aminotransferase class V-fold PLP-dependent enzyme [Noviherbaspirillum sp.]|nr:aminotransferase class V-fold PLP-dependent enzyme [Noviherbaspirillum sp.]